MTVALGLFFLLLVAGGVLGCAGTMRSSRNPLLRAVIVILRTLQVLLIGIAFTQPVITCNKLVDHNRSVAVLVDASESMSQFDLTALVNRTDSLFKVNSSSTTFSARTVLWYLFGDSLRPWNRDRAYTSLDRSSIFPKLSDGSPPGNAAEIVVVSDAHWSNDVSAAALLQNRAAWYIPLTTSRKLPFITCHHADTVQCQADSASTVSISVQGNLPADGYIYIKLMSSKAMLYFDSLQVSAGSFAQKITLPLPPLAAGFYPVTLHCYHANDTLVATRSTLLIHSVPHIFTYSCSPLEPSLDIRFIKSALASNNLMREAVATSTKAVDAEIVAGARDTITPGNSALIVLGKLFKRQENIFLTPDDHFIAVKGYRENQFSTFDASAMPPVTAYPHDTSMKNIAPLFSCLRKNDTIPLLYRCTIYNHPVLVCAISDFWKWDFLPLARTSGEGDNFAFTQRLIGAGHEMLFSLHTDTFLVAPAHQPRENSVTPLVAVIPSSVQYSPGQLHYSLKDASGTTIIDTSISPAAYQMLLRFATLPPLPAGNYTIRASLTTYPAVSCSTMLIVDKNRTEMTATGQNEALLRESCRLLDLNNPTHIDRLLQSGPSNETETLPQRFPLHRGWPLLIAIFCTLFTEWIIRKVHDLD